MAPLGDPPKTNLLNNLIYGVNVFFISALDILEMNILTYLGCHPPETPQTDPPKNRFFDWLKLGHYFFFF